MYVASYLYRNTGSSGYDVQRFMPSLYISSGNTETLFPKALSSETLNVPIMADKMRIDKTKTIADWDIAQKVS